ncbi:hypothetical protein ILUMI_08450 [Ignelater luminosus]|uniref:Mutator-like transposase domain-containing protein n=1 Tax=Ignelater luminosus TaxID=2038154 RepID=A0A8K0D634_IGNLU|nr:hypothetical protein ILUMI_08450 [Ignelater luminosus]
MGLTRTTCCPTRPTSSLDKSRVYQARKALLERNSGNGEISNSLQVTVDDAQKENSQVQENSRTRQNSIPGCSSWNNEVSIDAAEKEGSQSHENSRARRNSITGCSNIWNDEIDLDLQGRVENIQNENSQSHKERAKEHARMAVTEDDNSPFDCSIIDMTVESERRNGLLSTFVLKCKFCGITKKLFNENVEDTNKFDVNSAITLATISTRIGYSQIEEVAAGLNMPIMSDKTY